MAALDVPSLSRRELQLLAKELQLCRGNAKSDVIMQHVYEFVAANPGDGEQRVIALVGASSDAVKASAALEEKKAPSPPLAKANRASPSPAEAASNDLDTTDSDNSSPKTDKSQEKAKEEAASAVQQPERKSKSLKSSKSEAAQPVVAAKSDAATKRRRAEPAAPSDSSAAKASTSSPAVSAPVAAKVTEPKAKTVVASGNEQKISSGSAKATADASITATAPRRALASIENSPATAPVPADVSAFVAATDDLEFTKDGRVRCSTTAHEMKADLAVIKEHLRGKRYARARGLKKFSLAAYAPMFSAHPDEKLAAKLVWCNVTETAIVRTREQIEAHIAGPRYQKELPQWEEEQAAKVKAEAEAAERAQARKLAAMKKRKSEAQADGKSSKLRSS